jgi:hypothetical protein
MSGVLLIDPYASLGVARSDLKVMNQVADSVLADYAGDPDCVVKAVKAAHRPGMAAIALKIHVRRALGLPL